MAVSFLSSEGLHILAPTYDSIPVIRGLLHTASDCFPRVEEALSSYHQEWREREEEKNEDPQLCLKHFSRLAGEGRFPSSRFSPFSSSILPTACISSRHATTTSSSSSRLGNLSSTPQRIPPSTGDLRGTSTEGEASSSSSVPPVSCEEASKQNSRSLCRVTEKAGDSPASPVTTPVVEASRVCGEERRQEEGEEEREERVKKLVEKGVKSLLEGGHGELHLSTEEEVPSVKDGLGPVRHQGSSGRPSNEESADVGRSRRREGEGGSLGVSADQHQPEAVTLNDLTPGWLRSGKEYADEYHLARKRKRFVVAIEAFFSYVEGVWMGIRESAETVDDQVLITLDLLSEVQVKKAQKKRGGGGNKGVGQGRHGEGNHRAAA